MKKSREPANRFPRSLFKVVMRQIVARDGAGCFICGSTDNLDLDHIQPTSQGGTQDVENLQFLCETCHNQKSSEEIRFLQSTRGVLNRKRSTNGRFKAGDVIG